MIRTTAALAALTCVAALTVATPAPATVTKDPTLTLTVDGRVRTARIHLPNPMPDIRKVPLVLSFHGLLGNGDAPAGLSQFNTSPTRTGSSRSTPRGTSAAGTTDAGTPPSNRDGVKDVKFVRALLDLPGDDLPRRQDQGVRARDVQRRLLRPASRLRHGLALRSDRDRRLGVAEDRSQALQAGQAPLGADDHGHRRSPGPVQGRPVRASHPAVGEGLGPALARAGAVQAAAEFTLPDTAEDGTTTKSWWPTSARPPRP